MPLYNVPLQGGGSIQVNASDPAAAIQNVTSGGNAAAGNVATGGNVSQIPTNTPNNTFGGGGSPSLPSPGASGEQTLVNLQAQQAVLNAAQNAAQQAYLNAKLNLDTDELAFKKAQQAWQNTMSERQQTFSEGQSQASTALDYLKLGSQLTGPANAFRYARMLSGTPGGLRDIVNAAAGRYVLPRSGAGDPSVQGERMSLDSLAADSGAGGAISPYAAGVPTPSLPNPNQVDLRNYGAMLPGQKALLLAAYQDQGWDPADVDKMIAQSAPRYSGPSLGRVQF